MGNTLSLCLSLSLFLTCLFNFLTLTLFPFSRQELPPRVVHSGSINVKKTRNIYLRIQTNVNDMCLCQLCPWPFSRSLSLLPPRPPFFLSVRFLRCKKNCTVLYFWEFLPETKQKHQVCDASHMFLLQVLENSQLHSAFVPYVDQRCKRHHQSIIAPLVDRQSCSPALSCPSLRRTSNQVVRVS